MVVGVTEVRDERLADVDSSPMVWSKGHSDCVNLNMDWDRKGQRMSFFFFCCCRDRQHAHTHRERVGSILEIRKSPVNSNVQGGWV